MQTTVMTKQRARQREDLTNDGDKIWITISKTVNLDDYESAKIEAGFSQTIKDGENPMELLETAEKDLELFVAKRARIFQNKELRRKDRDE